LPGNNLSYKRELLEEIEPRFRQGFFETFIHEELRREGRRLYFHPAAIVSYRKRHRVRAALAQCYHAGRSFGGRRMAAAPALRRARYAAGSLLLPILRPARIRWRTLRRGREVRPALASLPHLVLLMTSWAAGEFCGYAFGEGESARMWK
jgi:hypothetical protein